MSNEIDITSHNVFRFISLLRENKHRIMRRKEIGKELGLKETALRALCVYKHKAELLGYKIESSHGIYGGYRLLEESLSLTELEEIRKHVSSELYEKIKVINERF